VESKEYESSSATQHYAIIVQDQVFLQSSNMLTLPAGSTNDRIDAKPPKNDAVVHITASANTNASLIARQGLEGYCVIVFSGLSSNILVVWPRAACCERRLRCWTDSKEFVVNEPTVRAQMEYRVVEGESSGDSAEIGGDLAQVALPSRI